MWYLLVAAGAGYFAIKWKNMQKPRPLCGQYTGGRTRSPTSSPSASIKRELYSSLSNSKPTSPEEITHDQSSGFISLHHKSSTQNLHTSLSNDVSLPPQETISNKISGCGVFRVNPAQVERGCPFLFTSKCSLMAADIIDNLKEEHQLKEERSPSPSSCCSSNSTVVNSPVNGLSILQRCDGALKYQGKDWGSHRTPQNGLFPFRGKERSIELAYQNPNLSHNANSESETSRDVSARRQKPHSPYVVVEPKLNLTDEVYFTATAVSDNRLMLDAGVEEKEKVGVIGAHMPISFSGKRKQRDDTRADLLLDDFISTPLSKQGFSQVREAIKDQSHDELIGTQFSKFDAKEDTSQTIARRIGSLLSPHNAMSQKSSGSMSDANSDASASFGFAMAFLLIISSSRREMEKIGKVLRETEDLVGDMRKELEARKLHLCGMDEGNNDDFFTIKLEDVVEEKSFRATSNHLETNAERSNTRVMGDAFNGDQWSRHSYFKDESDSVEGEAGFPKSMIELERRLWQVFQERQEERILELEEALHLALRKLHVKHEELCLWKNHVSLLMEQSCGALSGEHDTLEQPKRVGGLKCASNEYLRNEPWYPSSETSFLAAEGCVDVVGIKGIGSSLNLIGCPDGLARTSSTCSFSSGESVWSIDVSAFACPVNQMMEIHNLERNSLAF